MDQILRIIRHVKDQQRELELVILATPTSKTRELLTEANIHLMLVVEALEEVSHSQL